MKNLFTCLALTLLCGTSIGQNIPFQVVDGQVTFEAIAEIDSLTASQIHERSMNWVGKTFKNAEAVISSNTPSRIVGEYYIEDGPLGDSPFTPRFTIDIKEGKLKFLVDDTGFETWFLKGDRKTWRTMNEKMRTRNEAFVNALYQSLLDEIRYKATW